MSMRAFASAAVLLLLAASLATGCAERTRTPRSDAGPGGDAGTGTDAGPGSDAGPIPDGGCGPSPCGACAVGCTQADRCVASGWECACECPDAGPGFDAGAMCGGMTVGNCEGALSCQCCPAGGPAQTCLCSTPCFTSDDCSDPRPMCNIDPFTKMGFCTSAELFCCWGCD